MGKIIFILLVTVFACPSIRANEAVVHDSLQAKSYAYFSAAVNKNKHDKAVTAIYTAAWLSKARAQRNWQQLALAYKAMMYRADRQLLPHYADTLLSLAKSSGDKGFLGTAYLTKGIIHYDRKELTRALDNYLIADSYLSQADDPYSLYKVKYSIAHTKYYLGFYDEAIALFNECLLYFEAENDRAYLSTIHSLALCYNKLGNYTKSDSYNNLGLVESSRLHNTEMKVYFEHSRGVNYYFRKHYGQAVVKLQEVLPQLAEKKDFANVAVAHFYIAKGYWALNKKSSALPFLIKVNNAFVRHGYIRPDLRENFELLINFYRLKGESGQQLFYINRLLVVDRVLSHDYRYLSRKIHKEYDTARLLQAKHEIELAMRLRGRVLYTLLFILSTVIFFLVYRHYRNKKRYRQKFEQLMYPAGNIRKAVQAHNSGEPLDISPDVVTAVTRQLDRFEAKKRYLEKDMSLVRIAALLNTNTKYASKIIYRYRGKKTIEYISDLKIEHIIALLKSEKKYRNYTNKALADEAGFGSTQNFTRAFRNRTGISPTYFIQELKNLPTSG